MAAVGPNLIILPIPPQLFGLPTGHWGIAYDISTNRTEHDLPNGWNANRSNTYRQLIQILTLSGFHRHQYSDYRAEGATAVHALQTMWTLRTIEPAMKLQTTVLGMKMQHYHYLNLFDITTDIQLGGAGTPQLLGPVPANLIPANLPVTGILGGVPVPPANINRPRHTKNSNNATNPNNWRV